MSTLEMPQQVFAPKPVLAALDPPPRVSMLRGPVGVGKRTVCEFVAAGLGGERVRVERKKSQEPQKSVSGRLQPALSVEAAVGLLDVCSRRPRGGKRSVVVDLGGAVPEAANLLLRLLEEPPRNHSFLLHCDGPVLSALASRSMVLWLPLLDTEDVVSILVNLGWTGIVARRAAAACSGSVKRALAYEDPDQMQARQKVNVLLHNWYNRDQEGLANALSGADAVVVNALRAWATEARAKSWRMFDPAQSSGCAEDQELQDRILKLCKPGARPRLAARLALSPR